MKLVTICLLSRRPAIVGETKAQKAKKQVLGPHQVRWKKRNPHLQIRLIVAEVKSGALRPLSLRFVVDLPLPYCARRSRRPLRDFAGVLSKLALQRKRDKLI